MADSFQMANHISLCVWLLSLLVLAMSHETYIVHMDLSAKPTAFSSHHSWFSATLDSLTTTTTTTSNHVTSPSSSKLVYSYTNAINGFTAILSPSELELIKNTPGFLYSIKDTTVELDTTHSTQFLGLNSNSGAWPVASYGEDVIIGIVDTGVWPESESFIDHGMSCVPERWKGECEDGFQFNSSLCNKKLIGARYFNKGLLSNRRNLTLSMNSARDTDGHGTHTSSTAAGGFVKRASYFGYGTGTAIGVAPHARVAIYKAVWEEGVFVSDILAAIDQAIMDGVDVLSLSLGQDGIPLHQDPIAIASFAALEKGIFVSASAGNDGPYLRSLHNGTPWVLTVAASTMDREFTGMLTLGNGVSVTDLKSGKTVMDYARKLNSGEAKASLKFHGTRLRTKPAPRVASYSARGPSYSCPIVLKPDITAPGSLILAAWPDSVSLASLKNDVGTATELLYSKFNLLSGTSMSCPHASGVAALLKAAHPDWSPSAIRSAMMTTSDILDNTLKPIQDIGDYNNPATPLAMGSGHIAPNKAMNPGLIYDVNPQDYVNLLCGLNYTKTQIQAITRSSNVNCSNPSLDLNYPSFIADFDGNKTKSVKVIHEFKRTVTYVGVGNSTFTAKLTAVGRLNVSVSPKKLSFQSLNEKKSYKLRLEGPNNMMENEVVYGFLSWIDSKGKFVVRSPIVATSLTGTADMS
ncbi:putative cucumisin [Helianthus debilis subsp. tardiflorus]